MTLGVTGLLATLVSHAKTLGRFAAVLDYEPKAAPDPHGVTLALWADPIEAVPEDSGLNSVTARVTFAGRLYRSMLKEPQSDAEILGALDAYMVALSGDFTLGGTVRNIELLAMAATPGYIVQDSKLFRTVDLRIPLIVNDLWGMAP